MIAARGLTRRFGTRTVVDDVTVDVGRGEIVALLGPNGAGKTTTLRMLAGLVAPSSGTVVIDGVELTPQTGSVLRQRIGFLTEAPGLWDRLTVRENLSVYAELYGRRALAQLPHLLDELGLAQHAAVRAAELSKGMRQKVAIARALLHEPDVLLLDEPTSGLDPAVARSVRRLLRERQRQGCATLLSTHNLDEAERQADRIAFLRGRLVTIDTPAGLRARLDRSRVIVRVDGPPAQWVELLSGLGIAAESDGQRLVVRLDNVARDTPELVRTLAAAGAPVREIRPDEPGIEEVYFRLIGEQGDGTVGPS